MSGTPGRYVLIVSTVVDVATDDVVRRLAARSIPHRRVNTEDFPFRSTLCFGPSDDARPWLQIGGETYPQPAAIWYRRQRTPARPDGMDQGIYEFCMQETRAALVGGILTSESHWMSHPAAIWQAEYKPFQLALAARVGLAVPRTIVTNDPSEIRKAAASFRSMVVKPVRTGHVVHRGQEFAIYTSQLSPEHMDDLDCAQWSPSIYQELIPKRFDVRVTVVGRRIFAAAIDSQSDPAAVIDWRHTVNPELPHHRMTLPDEIGERVLKLTALLNLNFAAIDLVQRVDGTYVFLEVNPNGQWLWLDDKLDLGISEAVAEWLARRTLPC